MPKTESSRAAEQARRLQIELDGRVIRLPEGLDANPIAGAVFLLQTLIKAGKNYAQGYSSEAILEMRNKIRDLEKVSREGQAFKNTISERGAERVMLSGDTKYAAQQARIDRLGEGSINPLFGRQSPGAMSGPARMFLREPGRGN